MRDGYYLKAAQILESWSEDIQEGIHDPEEIQEEIQEETQKNIQKNIQENIHEEIQANIQMNIQENIQGIQSYDKDSHLMIIINITLMLIYRWDWALTTDLLPEMVDRR